MKAGTHKNVKIVGCFTGESKEKKTPYYGIEFENQQGESIEHVFYLSEKTKERNVDTLIQMGFRAKKISDLSNPKMTIPEIFGEPLDEISLVVVDEEYTNKEGEVKTKQVVQWVNVGNLGGASKVDHPTAVKIFDSSSLQGLLASKRQGKPTPKPMNTEKLVDNEDLPF